MFARKRRTSSGDKGICYGDSEQVKTEKPPSIHTLDPDPLTIKSGSPIPKKLPQIFDIEPAGKSLYHHMRFGNIFLFHTSISHVLLYSTFFYKNIGTSTPIQNPRVNTQSAGPSDAVGGFR